MIDKLMDNHWFLRGIALLLAIMLYMVINMDKQPQSSTGLPIGEATETIEDVEIAAYYDQDKYIVSGIPDSVSVTLEGSNTTIIQTKMKQQFEVFTNLEGYEPGTYEIRLQYNGIPDGLEVKLQPAKIRVTIEPRKTKAFPVEIGYLNNGQIKNGYTAEKATLRPSYVEIAGTEEQLEKVGILRAYVDLKGVDQTFTKAAKVVVYDESGNTLDLQTNPSSVSVTVTVTSPEKVLPIKVKQEGTLQQGLKVKGISVEPNEVTLYGSKDVLADISALDEIAVDVNGLAETTTFEANVPVPKGVLKLSPSKVKVTVQLEKQEPERKTITDVPVKITGLDEANSLSFVNPSGGKISVDAVGDLALLADLNASQIQASINVQDLKAGIHDVEVQLNGPATVAFELKQKTVQIEIQNKS